MSAWTAIVDRLKNRMETVPDVGIVYEERRLVTNEETVGSVLVTEVAGQRRARAWMIALEDVDARWATLGGTARWNRRAVLRGFFQLEDGQGSEGGALAIAEAVCAAVDADIHATRLDGTINGGGPGRITQSEPRVIAFVLCHYVEIEVPLMTLENR